MDTSHGHDGGPSSPRDLPPPVVRVVDRLAAEHGVVGVVLGGSRATGSHRPDSDWDLGVYYRPSLATFDPAAVRRLGYPGHVSDLGEWGPVVNGGAWLDVDGIAVDVLFRDLDTIESWIEGSRAGRFDILRQNGYLAGAPTYLPVGELAVCRPLHGRLPQPDFPEPLAARAAERWDGNARVALLFARGHAELGDTACCLGMLVQAALCVGHARLSARREWVLNEKHLLRRAGLEDLHELLSGPPPSTLSELVSQAESVLGVRAAAKG